MSDLVLRHDSDGLATLVLNRPEKLNAMNSQMFKDLRTHVDQLAYQVDTIGLVVLRGAGKCFSAGHDLSDLVVSDNTVATNFEAETIECLANLPQPVISAVHGHCYTGALELALAGDLIFASESASFADTHAKWSVTPIWGMSQRLPRRIGLSRAREMMFTGRSYKGLDALAMGLVNFCAADDTFDDELEILVREMLSLSWHTHRANKRLLLETDGMPLGGGLEHEIKHTAGVGPDMRNRIAAFTNKKR
ncbi:MAG: enoyl-CoA hydratase [Candidatus Marinimicrobia bacterium]|nr:enoyl-CoA hydratase [Candidatus Neomarinimicrobiota bacterium]